MKNRIIVSGLFILLIVSMLDFHVLAANGLTYDVGFDKSSDGIAEVLSDNQATIKTKLIIQKDEKKYTYNLKSKATYDNFPLQMGDGNYSLKVYENTTGTKYKNVYAESSTIDIKDEIAVFLTSNQQISWNLENKAIILANELVIKALKDKQAKNKNVLNVVLSDNEKIAVIYNYVINNMDYDYNKIKTLAYDYIPSIDTILQDRKGICFDYSVLLASMLRSQGIPAKLIKGYSTNTSVYHAWNEIYLSSEKRWIIVDTTFDAYMVDNKKSYTMEKALKDYKKEYEF